MNNEVGQDLISKLTKPFLAELYIIYRVVLASFTELEDSWKKYSCAQRVFDLTAEFAEHLPCLLRNC